MSPNPPPDTKWKILQRQKLFDHKTTSKDFLPLNQLPRSQQSLSYVIQLTKQIY